MEEKLISVIIPVFNVERYLGACLDSILEQSHKYLEIIVINDGSYDLSLKIAESYSLEDSRIRVYNYENAGLSEARNRGISVATGEFITFVDSDDMLLPGALEMLLRIQTQYDADIVQGKSWRGEGIKVKNKEKDFIKIYSSKEAIKNLLYQKDILSSVCGKLFKKELFEGIEFEKGLIYEDLNIMYLLLEKSLKIVYTNIPVYFYRKREESILTTWIPQRLDVLKVTEKIEDYITEKYPELLPAAKDRRLSANFNMFALCSIHDDPINAAHCWNRIKQYRKPELFNRNVRFKNKAGVILSYLGKNIFSFIARRIYK